MKVSLTRLLQEFVGKEISGGEVQTAGEAVRDGVRLLRDRSARRDFVVSRLRKEFEAVLGESETGHAAPQDVKKNKAER